MASLNDFKILNKKCDKYFEYLVEATGLNSKLEQIEQIERMRLGFYVFIIENLCSENDIDNIIESIIDTEFNNLLYGKKHDDCGVDAVYIDDENKVIRFFNFKFRKDFSQGSQQKLNDTVISSKYFNVLKTENYSVLEGKPLVKAKEVLTRLHSNDEWSLILYQVSNESVETKRLDYHIENMMESYDLEVKAIALPSISEMMSIRPKPINASLVLEKEAVMSFSSDNIESAKSYITRISSAEIVRITSNSVDARNNHNIEEICHLSNLDIDYGVLFDNVRGFVLKSKYNPNIIKSLQEEPNKFFMYNNGITIVAKGIDGKKINGDKRVKLEISDFQVLNGGQTVRSIHKFNRLNTENISKYLSASEVLVRIFKADPDNDEINKIAEYTNSQNSIKPSDLKSLSVEQIEIERYLEEHGIIYSRKSGETGDLDKSYKHKITMEKFGQILTAAKGNPERSTNSIQDIFEKYYRDLFIKNFNINDSPRLIESYFDIIKEYKKKGYKGVQLKYFYIIFINSLAVLTDYALMIDELEYVLKKYTTESETSEVRKLGQTRFREELVSHLNIKYSK